jgi:hypothetical protein
MCKGARGLLGARGSKAGDDADEVTDRSRRRFGARLRFSSAILPPLCASVGVFGGLSPSGCPGAEAGAGKALTPLRHRPECLGDRPNGYLNTAPFSKCLYSATLRD